MFNKLTGLRQVTTSTKSYSLSTDFWLIRRFDRENDSLCKPIRSLSVSEKVKYDAYNVSDSKKSSSLAAGFLYEDYEITISNRCLLIFREVLTVFNDKHIQTLFNTFMLDITPYGDFSASVFVPLSVKSITSSGEKTYPIVSAKIPNSSFVPVGCIAGDLMSNFLIENGVRDSDFYFLSVYLTLPSNHRIIAYPDYLDLLTPECLDYMDANKFLASSGFYTRQTKHPDVIYSYCSPAAISLDSEKENKERFALPRRLFSRNLKTFSKKR